jgi:hypothetical protein
VTLSLSPSMGDARKGQWQGDGEGCVWVCVCVGVCVEVKVNDQLVSLVELPGGQKPMRYWDAIKEVGSISD